MVFVFVEHFLGPGWHSSIRRVWQVHLVCAVTAIAIDIGTGTPLATVGLNNVLVVVWMVVVLANLAAGAFRLDREIRIVRVGTHHEGDRIPMRLAPTTTSEKIER